MLTAKDIGEKQFKVTRIKEGYDQKEVDDFLDKVEDSFAVWQAKVKELAALVDELEAEKRKFTDAPTMVMPPVETPTATAERLLKVAEKTAEEHLAEARVKADEIVRDAGARGAKIIEDSQHAGQKQLAEAQGNCERVAVRRERLTEEIRQLEDKRRTYKSWLRAQLEYMEGEEAANG